MTPIFTPTCAGQSGVLFAAAPHAPKRGQSSTLPAATVYSGVQPAPARAKMAAGVGPAARGRRQAWRERLEQTRQAAARRIIDRRPAPRAAPRPHAPSRAAEVEGGRPEWIPPGT